MLGKLALLLLVAVVAFGLPPPRETLQTFQRPNEDLRGVSRYMLIGDEDITYDNARRLCTQTGSSGGVLAELETKEEEQDVINFFKTIRVEDRLVWVAGKWRGNYSYVWESGLPLRNDTPWRAEEPSLNGLDIRVAMGVNADGIEMFTSDRDEKYYALCEFQDTQ